MNGVNNRMAIISARVLAFALSVVMLFTFSSCGEMGEDDTSVQEEYMMTSLDYEYKTDVSAYAEILNTESEACLVLANKTYPVGKTYAPEKVVTLDRDYTFGGKLVELGEYAAVAVKAIIDEMRAHGIDNVYVTSGYRNYEYQESLFKRYCDNERAEHPTWSEERIEEEVLTYSAYPGTSEHQTGLCVDFMTTEMEGLWNFGSETPNNPYDKGFAETEAFEWLCDNAHKFGFILRYPQDKTDITGYSYESWHYRFVGIGAASIIYNEGLTLEEYLGR